MLKNENSVLLIKEYGKINLKLKELMDKDKIKRGSLARATNTRFEVIDKWYNNDLEKLDLDILARICYVLECDISDILIYEKIKQFKNQD